MRLFEFDLKSRVKRAIDKLDDQDPLLIHIKNAIFDNVFQEHFEKANLNEKARTNAIQWFKGTLEALRVPLEEKIKLLKLLTDSSNLIQTHIFAENNQGNLFSLVGQKIQNNQAYHAIKESLWNFKIGGQGGMGPGELFMILLCDSGKEAKGNKSDITVGSDWDIEVKQGGVIPPGDSGKRIVDSLNSDLLDTAETNGFKQLLDTSSKTSFSTGWIPQFFTIYAEKVGEDQSKKKLTEYLTNLYNEEAAAYTDMLYAALGTEDAAKAIAPLIFKMYKLSHQWNSICILDDSSNFINLVDFQNLPDSMSYTIVLKRGKGQVDDIQAGGDTNATADGYLLTSFKKTKKERTTTSSRQRQRPIEQPKPVDPTVIKRNVEVNSADDRFIEILKDPTNPITLAWRNKDPAVNAVELKDTIIELLIDGEEEQDIADMIASGDLYESWIRLFKVMS